MPAGKVRGRIAFLKMFLVLFCGAFFAPQKAAAQCAVCACSEPYCSNYGPTPNTFTGCPRNTGPAYPRHQQITHYQSLTGIGYGYVITATEGSSLVVAGIPPGAAIVRAYLWKVHKGATPDTSATFNAAAITGMTVGEGNFGWRYNHPEYGTTFNCCWTAEAFWNIRFDVTARITGNGTYSVGPAALSYTLAVVYADPANTDRTTVMFADGLHVWHPEDYPPPRLNDGFPPVPVTFDWSCEGNPICNPVRTRFSRSGGQEFTGNWQQFRDEFLAPGSTATSQTQRWVSAPGGFRAIS